MSCEVGANGQVVIPKAIRNQVGIQPGDEVTFKIEGNAVCIRRVADGPGARGEGMRSLRGRFADTPGSSAKALEADRREERERDKRRERERAARRAH